jgi:DNA-binding transcriptional LysR family regulator
VTHIVEAMNDMLDLRQGPPRGFVRIRSTVGFGRKVVAPLLFKFSEVYPDIAVDLSLDDRPADFAAEQIDVAFRDGFIEDSSIIAKQLIPMQRVLCASPAYAEERGLPSTLEDLAQHDCINLRSNGRVFEWDFKVDGHMRKYLPTARLTFNDADLVLRAVLEGRGIAQMPGYQICDYVARNELVMALRRYLPDDRGHYICYLCRQNLPSRIRVLVDFMTEEIRALNPFCLGEFNPDDLENGRQA